MSIQALLENSNNVITHISKRNDWGDLINKTIYT